LLLLEDGAAAMPWSTPRMFTSIMRFHSSIFNTSSLEAASSLHCSPSHQGDQTDLLQTHKGHISETRQGRDILLRHLQSGFRMRSPSRSVRRAQQQTLVSGNPAVASPMPLLAPVMAMTLLPTFNILTFLIFLLGEHIFR